MNIRWSKKHCQPYMAAKRLPDQLKQLLVYLSLARPIQALIGPIQGLLDLFKYL